MAKASITFQVPGDAKALATALDETGALTSDLPGTDCTPLSECVAEAEGKIVRFDFEEDDPIHGVLDAAKVLETAGISYWGLFDAFTERSRGMRVLGRVVLNLTGEPSARQEKEIPWTHGEPSYDERTLVAAGFGQQEVDEIIAMCFPPAAPSIRP